MPIYALDDHEPELPEPGRFWGAPDAHVIGRAPARTNRAVRIRDSVHMEVRLDSGSALRFVHRNTGKNMGKGGGTARAVPIVQFSRVAIVDPDDIHSCKDHFGEAVLK